MPEAAEYPQYPPSSPILNRDRLIIATSNPIRWQILRAMHDGGEAWGSGDIARLTGITVSGASKHMRVLLEAGICVQGRGRLYRLAPQFQPRPGSTPRILDLGHVILRLDLQAPNAK